MHKDCNPSNYMSVMEGVKTTTYVLTSNDIDLYVISRASGGFKW